MSSTTTQSLSGTLAVTVAVDVAEALRRGHAARRQQAIELDVAALSPEDRDLIARYLYEGDGNQSPRGWCVGKPYYSYGIMGARGMLQISEPTVDGLLSALREAHALAEHERDAALAKEEQEKAREAAERAAKVAALRSAPADDLVVEDRYERTGHRWKVHHLAEEAGRLSEAEAEAERRNAADVAAAEREREEKARQEAQAAEERAAWIEAHGSPRLKRLVAEGIEHDAVYRDERLALERPGWRWDRDVPGSADDPRNAPMSALELLDEARETDPDAELVYWTVHEEDDEDDDGEPVMVRGYTCVAEFLGRRIVYRVADDGTPPIVID